MTTFTRCVKQTALVAATVTVAVASVVAQAPPPQQTGSQTPQRQQGLRPNPRGVVPPGGELNVQTVQNLVDAWALVEAQQELALADGQLSDFVAKMQRVQSTRRRHMMERQRQLRELRALAFASQKPDDAALTEKLKAFDQLNERSAQEMRQVVQELDGMLTPYQRVRFRVFEEAMERRKIDLLTRARAGRAGGGGATAPAQPPPATGRGGR
jgi:hypothetical protein